MNTDYLAQPELEVYESLAMQKAGRLANFREDIWRDLELYMEHNDNPTKYGFAHFLQAKQYVDDLG